MEPRKDDKKNFEKAQSSNNDKPSLQDKTPLGPVVRLPVDTKIVMRLDAPKGGSSCATRVSNRGTSSCNRRKEDLAAKIDEV